MSVGPLGRPNSNGQLANGTVRWTLASLPTETQKDIIKHVPRKYLKNVQLVSKHFHDLASAEIYGDLEFCLTHPDSPSYCSTPGFRLPYALHMFATSAHDYAHYVRNFRLYMSEQDSDEIQRRVASKYHFQEEASLLLNTNLLLMIRKACALELFVWDAPIELHPDVYSTLAKSQSLDGLFIRYDITSVPRVSFSLQPPPPPGLTASVGNPALPPAGGLFGGHPPPPIASSPLYPRMPKHRQVGLRTKRPTLSRFKNLHELTVVGIDNMEIVSQVATCMQQCSILMRSVTFALAPQFAKKARKPPVGNASQYTMTDPLDDDDDMTQPNSPTLPTPAPPPAANEADRKKEQKLQESILARIFGFAGIDADDRKIDKTLKAAASKVKSADDQDEVFVKQLKEAVGKLAKVGAKPNSQSNLLRPALLDTLQKAANKYLESTASKKKKSSSKETQPLKGPFFGSKGSKSKVPHPHHHAFHSSSMPHPPSYSSSGYPFNEGGVSNPFGDPKGKMPSNITFDDFDFDSFINDQDSFPPLPQPTTTGNLALPSFSGPSTSSPYLPSTSSTNGLNPAYALPSSSKPGHTTLYSNSGQPLGPPINNHALSLYYPNMVAQPGTDLPLSVTSKWDPFPGPLPPSKSPLASNAYTPPPISSGPNGSGPLPDEDSSSSDFDDEATADAGSKAESKASKSSGSKSTNGHEDGPSDDSKSQSHEDPSQEEDMGVDMDHPDVMDEDLGDEYGGASHSSGPPSRPSELSGSALPTPNGTISHGTISKVNGLLAPPDASFAGPSSGAIVAVTDDAPSSLTPEEQMREYIRRKHGFSLEHFGLYLVPLKPSVLAKALDLACLRSLALLGVGPQGAFWALMERHHTDFAPLQLTSVHTDDVSLAFLSCINKLRGLEELFLVRRKGTDVDCTTSKAPASLNDIRTLALRRHIGTLGRLSVMNNDDDAWDLDGRCLRLIAAKGAVLEELAFSCDMTDFHTFIQCLPKMTPLIAVHLLALRSPDRQSSAVRECRKFILDMCQHYPALRLKYVAASGFVHEIGEVRKSSSLPSSSSSVSAAFRGDGPPPPVGSTGRSKNWKAPLGFGGAVGAKDKGKAPMGAPPMGGDEEEGESEEGLSDIESASPDIIFVKHVKFCEVPDVEIFSKAVRLGRV